LTPFLSQLISINFSQNENFVVNAVEDKIDKNEFNNGGDKNYVVVVVVDNDAYDAMVLTMMMIMFKILNKTF
jgi:hypothetical protein